MITNKFIDNNWTESEKMFTVNINISENNINYVNDNWEQINESRIQDMLIVSSRTNNEVDVDIDQSVFA